MEKKRDKIIIASASRWLKNKHIMQNDPLNNSEFDIIDGIIVSVFSCVIFRKILPY